MNFQPSAWMILGFATCLLASKKSSAAPRDYEEHPYIADTVKESTPYCFDENRNPRPCDSEEEKSTAKVEKRKLKKVKSWKKPGKRRPGTKTVKPAKVEEKPKEKQADGKTSPASESPPTRAPDNKQAQPPEGENRKEEGNIQTVR